jgi:hypothetical protein
MSHRESLARSGAASQAFNGEPAPLGRLDLLSVLLGLVIAGAVCYPFFGGGRLYLLDWVLGPHAPLPTSSFFGLNGGLVTSMPFQLLTAALGRVVGSAATWLTVIAFFPLAAFGIARLVDIGGGGEQPAAAMRTEDEGVVSGELPTGGRSGTVQRGSRVRIISRFAAILLYCVNPFVFDRLFAGQIAFLFGYALLPYVVSSLVRAHRRRGVQSLTPALFIAAAAGCSIQFTWIGAILVVATAISLHLRRRVILWLFLVGVAFVIMMVYVIVPSLGHQLPVTVGRRSLEAFRTLGDPHLGLIGNVLGLYGFWRVGPVLAKDIVSGWPFILLAILVVITVGARDGLKGRGLHLSREGGGPADRSSDRRVLAVILLISGTVGCFLAMGNQGPTGALFSWAYYHIPFFGTMREPEKFSSLLALAYSVFFGWGLERLVLQARGRSSVVAAVILGIALPLAYTPTIFGGLDGQVAASHPPASWSKADTIMGSGPGKALFLPWHLYLSFPFTNERIIANPAASSFRRNVIMGDNIQLPGMPTDSTSRRSAFLQYVFANGAMIHTFGHLVAPLDIRWVILAKTVDWRSYSWLNHQKDLTKVLDTPTLEMWRNDAKVFVGERMARLPSRRSPSSWPGLLAAAYSGRSSGNSRTTTGAGVSSSACGGATVRRTSEITYSVSRGRCAWVELSQPYQAGWTSGRFRAVELARGNMAVRVGNGAAVVRYSPWGWIELGYVVSGGTFVILAVLIGVQMATRRRRW